MPEANQVKWIGVRRTDPAELLYASEDPASTATINQVSVTAVATQIVAANTARQSLTIVNQSSTDAYIGTSASVTTANGLLLAAGASAVMLRYTGAVFGITASGTATIGYADL